MIPRRTLLAAAPALIGGPRAMAMSKDLAVRGSHAYSESAMVMSVSPDGSSAVTLRFCRFPVEGCTWLWCHVLHDGELYAFVRHDLPCSAERLAGAPRAEYRAPPADALLSRDGRGPGLTEVRLAAALPFHHSRSAPQGPGSAPGRFDGVFRPTHALGAQVLEGRNEVYGTFRAEIEVGGRRFVHEGPAKFHEQRQEAPRFEQPFCYSWLAGEGLAATTLLIKPGATGGWWIDGTEAPLADMTIDPPGQDRQVAWRVRDGRVLPGRVEALVRYTIPVYDRLWNGSFVRGVCDGRPIVGVVNDWTTQPDIYAAARLRAAQP